MRRVSVASSVGGHGHAADCQSSDRGKWTGHRIGRKLPGRAAGCIGRYRPGRIGHDPAAHSATCAGRTDAERNRARIFRDDIGDQACGELGAFRSAECAIDRRIRAEITRRQKIRQRARIVSIAAGESLVAAIKHADRCRAAATLRKICGSTFAAGQPENAKLSDVLEHLNETSLSQLVHDHGNGKLDHKLRQASPD